MCGYSAVTVLVVLLVPATGASPATAFSTPELIGYTAGDDWEPAVASDGAGNVYIAWAHFGGVPGCGTCGSPAALVEVSHDGGRTFTAATPLWPSAKAEIDFNVEVNASGAVFISYLFGKYAVVQRSTDHGSSWSAPTILDMFIRQGATDKPGLAVQGSNVYVAYDNEHRMFVSSSHDGGLTFSTVGINSRTLDSGLWSLNAGGTVGPSGTVYFSWVGLVESGNALGLNMVFLTTSTDGGSTWSIDVVDSGLPPGPGCGYPQTCGWDFLGPQMVVAVDSAGSLFVLYNAGTHENGAPYLWFRSLAAGHNSWSPRVQVTGDGTNVWHVFPAMSAVASGDVRIAWMDNRTGMFNVWYRSTTDGGATWSSVLQVSQHATGFIYDQANGFGFPYGDYFVLNLDPKGTVHLAWGEGPSYVGPGNVWYAHS